MLYSKLASRTRKTNMLRKIVLTIIAFSFALSACSNPHISPVSNSTIFFTFIGKENWEIWKVNRDGTQFETIYEIPRKLLIDSAQEQQLITPRIATELKDKPFLLKEDEVLETNIVDIQIIDRKADHQGQYQENHG